MRTEPYIFTYHRASQNVIIAQKYTRKCQVKHLTLSFPGEEPETLFT